MPSIPTKLTLHPRNRHREGYDFAALTACTPGLRVHLRKSPAGTDTIDFANPDAVKALNQALLHHHYGVQHWDLPSGYLCPPIPGRADYIHYLADLIADGQDIPRGPTVRVLDIGTGASAIYPTIGTTEYGWSFVGSDIDADALRSARSIVDSNPVLAERIELRLQWSPIQHFRGVIQPGESFHLTMCNPPFHRSMAEANASTQRKLTNLGGKPTTSVERNFSGQAKELCCPGGEFAFITRLINESASYPALSLWFTSLVSKGEHLTELLQNLRRVGATSARIIDMAQGQKKTRFLAWSFLPR